MISNFYTSLINKTISFLLAFSLLAVSFTFTVNENVKQEFSVLYKATSICEYYNSITNFSHELINKILKSANITSAYTSKADTSKNKKQSKKKNRFDFVQPNNESSIKNLKSNNVYLGKVLFTDNNLVFYNLGKNVITDKVFVLLFTFLSFCYFARGNIDDNIKNYNTIIKNRLV